MSSSRSCRQRHRAAVAWKNSTSGFHSGFSLARRRLVLRRRCEIDTPAIALGNDRHQPRAHAPSLALGLDVVAAIGVPDIRHESWRRARAWCRSSRLRILRLSHLHREAVAAILDHWLNVSFLARLGGEHEGRGERHVHLRERRVRALHRARPEPGDHGELTSQRTASDRAAPSPFRP